MQRRTYQLSLFFTELLYQILIKSLIFKIRSDKIHKFKQWTLEMM